MTQKDRVRAQQEQAIARRKEASKAYKVSGRNKTTGRYYVETADGSIVPEGMYVSNAEPPSDRSVQATRTDAGLVLDAPKAGEPIPDVLADPCADLFKRSNGFLWQCPEPAPAEEAQGKIKILFRIVTAESIKYYVGGDRKTPKLVAEVNLTEFSTTTVVAFNNAGAGANDFYFGLRSSFLTGGTKIENIGKNPFSASTNSGSGFLSGANPLGWGFFLLPAVGLDQASAIFRGNRLQTVAPSPPNYIILPPQGTDPSSGVERSDVPEASTPQGINKEGDLAAWYDEAGAINAKVQIYSASGSTWNYALSALDNFTPAHNWIDTKTYEVAYTEQQAIDIKTKDVTFAVEEYTISASEIVKTKDITAKAIKLGKDDAEILAYSYHP